MPAKSQPLAYLRGTALQGSADAFKEVTVPTGHDGSETKALRVKTLTVEWDNLAGGDTDQVEFQFTRKSQTAMVDHSNKTLIFKKKTGVFLTTSGALVLEYVDRTLFVEDDAEAFIIVEENIYFAIDSNSQGAARTATFTLGYEEVSISREDRFNLLVNALS